MTYEYSYAKPWDLKVDVAGEPKGQPRPRAFARKMGGKYVARVYDAGTAEGWKSLVAAAVRPHLPDAPWTEPLIVELSFTMPRPRGHFRTGKRAHELRDDAPSWHTGKPDGDNLAKAVLDTLSQIGLWRDDCQVVVLRVLKAYPTCDEDRVGCEIWVRRLKP
jgi:Holliday junction resolvase RusA-like endonuclease